MPTPELTTVEGISLGIKTDKKILSGLLPIGFGETVYRLKESLIVRLQCEKEGCALSFQQIEAYCDKIKAEFGEHFICSFVFGGPVEYTDFCIELKSSVGKTKEIEIDGNIIQLIKEPDDPLCTRISLGGKDGNFYCVYRGELPDVKNIIELMHKAIQQL